MYSLVLEVPQYRSRAYRSFRSLIFLSIPVTLYVNDDLWYASLSRTFVEQGADKGALPIYRPPMKDEEIGQRRTGMQKEGTEETGAARTSRVLPAIIANPTSGSYAHHATHLEETVAFLQDHGWNVALKLTEAAGDGRRLAREAVNQQAEVVIAAGGDGTINEVIQELVGTETALGVLPIGTVNDWAREIGIPLDVKGARDVLVHGRTRHIDLVCVNEHYFLLMVGIGLDGAITQKVEQHPLKRLGVVGYLLTSIWYGLRYRSFVTSVISNEREQKTSALQIVVGNTQLYGGAMYLSMFRRSPSSLTHHVCTWVSRSIGWEEVFSKPHNHAC
jgi:diacylglycerol kinase family enzyme